MPESPTDCCPALDEVPIHTRNARPAGEGPPHRWPRRPPARMLCPLGRRSWQSQRSWVQRQVLIPLVNLPHRGSELRVTHRVRIRSEHGDDTTHWTEILLDYPRAVGIAPPEKVQPCFSLSQENRNEAQERLNEFDFGSLDGPLIGFHSGKGLELTSQRWPVDRFAQFARELQEQLNARLVLTGGPQEIEIVGAISSQLQLPHANLSGKTRLPVLAALAEACDLFVCPDSGPMHLAAAVKTPVVGIYALDEDFPKRWAPFGVPHRIIRPPRPACPPGCKKPTCPNFSCYLKVQPSEVVAAASQLLATDD